MIEPATINTPSSDGFFAPPATPTAPVTPTAENFFSDRVTKDGTFVEGWTQSLSVNHPALANQLMRYKTEGDAFIGLENLVKMVGQKASGISYPKAGATDDAVAAYRKDAGVPGRAEEYMLKPDQLPEGMAWDEATGKTFSALMHAHHIPESAAKALVGAHLEMVASQATGAATATQAKLDAMVMATTGELQKEWGVGFRDRVEANTDFVNARLSKEDMADPALRMALSHPGIVRIIDEARRAGRELPLPGANNTTATGSMTPRMQAMEIMKSNPGWQRDTALSARVSDLYKQESQAMVRRSR